MNIPQKLFSKKSSFLDYNIFFNFTFCHTFITLDVKSVSNFHSLETRIQKKIVVTQKLRRLCGMPENRGSHFRDKFSTWVIVPRHESNPSFIFLLILEREFGQCLGIRSPCKLQQTTALERARIYVVYLRVSLRYCTVRILSN